MKTRQLFFLTLFLGLMCEFTSASTVFISGDGSGDFNCDGIDDHVQINQALDYAANHTGTTVYLKGPFTYVINDTLLIGNNTFLEGDSNVVVKLKNNANWEMWKPLLSAISYNSKDIVIAGFKIDGNRGENTVSNPDSYHLLIKLTNCENISIHNMNLTNNNGDGARLVTCKNICFYNNLVSNLGHDGLYAITCSNATAYNNSINCRWNSGLRVYNTNNVSLHDNIIYSDSSDGCGSGIEIEKYNFPLMNNIEIYNNIISNTTTSGIWLFGYGTYSGNTTHARIYNNIIYNVGKSPTMIDKMGGIHTDGWNVFIENNVIDGTWVAGIRIHHVSGIPELNTDYINVTVRNNIITNTKAKLSELGYGIHNQIPDTHNFVLEYNCLYNNAGGNYNNTEAGMTDFYRNPLFVNNGSHDYHLKSKAGHWNGAVWVLDSANSPCIDEGQPLSAYSNEPKPNGDRINIGAYGNTPYAEKSYYLPVFNETFETGTGYWIITNNSINSTKLPRLGDYSLVVAETSNASRSINFSTINTNGINNSTERDLILYWNPQIKGNVSTISLEDNRSGIPKKAIEMFWYNNDTIIFSLYNNSNKSLVSNSSAVAVPFGSWHKIEIISNSIVTQIFVNDTIVQFNGSDSSSELTNVYNIIRFSNTNTISTITDTASSSVNIAPWPFSSPRRFIKLLNLTNYNKNNIVEAKLSFYLDKDAETSANILALVNGQPALNLTQSTDIAPGVTNPPSAWHTFDIDKNLLINGINNITVYANGVTNIYLGRDIAHAYNRSYNSGDSGATWTEATTYEYMARIVLTDSNPYYVDDIYLSALPTVNTNFTASPTSGVAPLSVQFNDTSEVESDSWSWDFNNDSIPDSHEQNPVHTYIKPGLYSVNLTVINECGTFSAVKTNYINVS